MNRLYWFHNSNIQCKVGKTKRFGDLVADRKFPIKLEKKDFARVGMGTANGFFFFK